MKESKAALVTGYPGFVAELLIKELANRGVQVFAICKEKHVLALTRKLSGTRTPVRVFSGDVSCMDLGLAGTELRELQDKIAWFFHLASIYYLGVSREQMFTVNLEGTRNAIVAALSFRHLECFVYYSTAFVAGDRQGVILEQELECAQRFANAFEESKAMAERLVRRAMKDIPAVVVRPSIVVGHSKTGEIGRLDGPHKFIYILINLPLDISLPIPGKGNYPLNLVPADYVVDAIMYLGLTDKFAGKTYHLVDLNPLSARQVFELVAKTASKKPPKGSIPPNLAAALMRIPGLERFWRSPRTFVEYLNRFQIFNAMNATQDLGPAGILCPPFPSYVGQIVKFMQKGQK